MQEETPAGMGGCKAKYSGHAHAFQVQTGMPAPTGGPAVRPAPMLFCSNCGDSYMWGQDGKWHKVEVGEPWAERVESKHQSA